LSDNLDYTSIAEKIKVADDPLRILLSAFNATLPNSLYDEDIGKEVAIEVPPKSHINGRIGVP
jgi:hypothetical protein